MARGKQDIAHSDESSNPSAPGTSIIAKPKGFPAWPALILADSDVPSDVKAVKPSKKGVIPVIFYNDNSFLWISPDETQPSTRAIALKNSKAKVKRALKDAYAMVADAPEGYTEIMSTFFPIEVNNAEEEQVEEPPAPEPVSESPRRARSARERAAEQKPQIIRSRKRVSESPAPESKSQTPKKSKKETPKKKEPTPAEEEDESEYVDQTEGTTDASEELDLHKSQAARSELCSTARTVLQEHLLVEKITSTGPVEDILTQLEEAPEIEIALVRKSKLHRVLAAAIVQVVPIELMVRSRKLHDQWSTPAEPVIRGIPENLAPREPSEAPELESRASTPNPENETSNNEVKEETDNDKNANGVLKQESEEPKEATTEPEEPKKEMENEGNNTKKAAMKEQGSEEPLKETAQSVAESSS